jgi:hypothetical protein
MPAGATDSRIERCQRCFQPLPPGADRCPGCGTAQTQSVRKIGLYVGILAILGMVALVVLSLWLKADAPPSDIPDDSTPVEQHAEPPKPPALDR